MKLFGVKSGQAPGFNLMDEATMEKQLDGLIGMVEEKIERSSNYRWRVPPRMGRVMKLSGPGISLQSLRGALQGISLRRAAVSLKI